MASGGCIKAVIIIKFFSELFICNLGKTLGFNMADYEYDDGYVKTKRILRMAEVNFEPICSVIGDNEDYSDNFDYFATLSKGSRFDYLKMLLSRFCLL